MKIHELLAGFSALAILGGCSGAISDDPEAGRPDVAGEHEPGVTEPGSKPTEGSPLIRGIASAIFPSEKPEDCRPLGFPVTLFPGALALALVSETATPISDTECSHEQVLAAPADGWASLAYNTICGGGGDARLCGTQATRLCSIDLMMRWAEERTEPVAVTDPIFGFRYIMPPLDEASRLVLVRRTLDEVYTMLLESEAVLSAASAGTRDCPNEDYDQIRANAAASFNLYQQISARLRAE